MFKTVRQNFSTIGGYIYRLTSNGAEVRVEEKSPRSQNYRVVTEMPLSVYETICAETQLETECDAWLYNVANGRA
jgi:hypothetical protein